MKLKVLIVQLGLVLIIKQVFILFVSLYFNNKGRGDLKIEARDLEIVLIHLLTAVNNPVMFSSPSPKDTHFIRVLTIRDSHYRFILYLHNHDVNSQAK